MKTILVVSDTHGRKAGLEKLYPLIAENDYVIHLGDGANDMRDIRSLYPNKVYACAGNCDGISCLPEDGVLEVEDVRIFFCHGHKHQVRLGLDTLAYAAKERDCDVALYGHTHNALISEIGGVTLVNPGSLQTHAWDGGSYAYLVVNKNKVTATLVGNKYF